MTESRPAEKPAAERYSYAAGKKLGQFLRRVELVTAEDIRAILKKPDSRKTPEDWARLDRSLEQPYTPSFTRYVILPEVKELVRRPARTPEGRELVDLYYNQRDLLGGEAIRVDSQLHSIKDVPPLALLGALGFTSSWLK